MKDTLHNKKQVSVINKLIVLLSFCLIIFTSQNIYANSITQNSTPCNGIIGGMADNDDFDGDGICNDIDLDDDNDGILDTTESINCTASIDLSTFTFHGETSIISNVSGTDFNVAVGNSNGWRSAYSDQELELPIHLEFTTPTTAGRVMLGLISVNDTERSTSWNDNAEKFFFWAGNRFYGYFNATWNPGATAYSTNDKFELDIDENGFVTVKRNGTEIRSYQGQASNYKIAVTSQSIGKEFQNFIISDANTERVCSDIDTDNDNKPDRFDLDSDGDGCSDAVESGATGNLTFNYQFPDVDSNDDGLVDLVDNGTNNGTANDGIPDYIASNQFVIDSTTNICTDTDNDGILDHIDIDDDNDGILDSTESINCSQSENLSEASFHGTTSIISSFDGSTLDLTSNNTWKSAYSDQEFSLPIHLEFTVPTVTNYAMIGLIATNRTEVPNGYLDLGEKIYLAAGSHWSLHNNAQTGHNAYTAGDKFEMDIDVTGFVTLKRNGTQYRSFQGQNSDYKIVFSSGIFDKTFENFKISEKNSAYTCTDKDTDGDGIVDRLDLDSDGDGCSDAAEVGATGDLTTNFQFSGTDTNNDGLVDLVDNGANNGTANDGTPDYNETYQIAIDSAINACIDSDNDGVLDHIDIDDDNDGILDTEEDYGETVVSLRNKPITVVLDGGWFLSEKTQTVTIPADFNSGDEIWVLAYDHVYTKAIKIKIEDTMSGILFTQTDAKYVFGNLPNFDFNSGGTNAAIATSATAAGYGIASITYEGEVIVSNYFGATGQTWASNTVSNNDIDGDGIINSLDLDSDGDGCSDAAEAGVPTTLIASGTNPDDGIANNTDNAVIDINIDPVGANGYANSLEDNDTSTAASNFTNSYANALDSDLSACGVPMITQIYQTATERWIEITNTHQSGIISKSSFYLSLFKDSTGDNSNVSPTASFTNSEIINAGESILIKSNSSGISNIKGSAVTDNNVTDFSDTNDVIVISKTNDNSSWSNRIDEVHTIENNTSYVRIDDVTEPNTTFTASEWVAFVDDNLDPYRDLANGGPQRHPHDPLLSEIVNSNSEANTLLGLHRINLTTRENTDWSNGYPDRSRHVVINQDHNHTDKLSARKLVVTNNNNLTVTNNLLVVTNDITLTNTNDEIRLVGNSQLIQTHTDATKITGDGKLYIDQNSEVPSKYRYNYLSSPVNTVGSSTFSIEDVLKDGTNPTSFSGTPGNNMAQDITFVGGYDGNTSSPIAIADYWIYTYASGDGGRSNWSRKGKAGDIPQTDGFTFKGPGQAQNYTFSGTPKDGNLPTAIGANESYLVGNPYASALSAKKFIEDNIDAIDGTLYFWQHAGEEDTSTDTSGHNYAGYVGGYSTRNISMGLSADQVTSNDNSDDSTPSLGSGSYTAPKPYIAVGQGFFISGDTDGGAITFNNSQREYKTEGTESVFFRTASAAKKVTKTSKNTLPIIKLGLDYKDQNDAGLHRQIGISFNKNNTFASDKGYDSKVYVESNTDFYWKFDEDENKYAIAGVQAITPELEVPLELVVENAGELTIKIDEWQYINRNVFLKDIENDTIYKLNDSKATLNLASGTYTDRFALAFDGENEDEATKETKNPLKVFYNKKNNRIVVVKKDKIKVKQVSLFRINSRKVQNWNIKKQRNKFKLKLRKKFSKGLYVVKIKTNKGIINKKIVIKN
ncbi:hypothetical protein OD91_2576 [Lutibacter sp. Hel_I_33_5]|uniref:hypothetical protein n=1 Tax=Lutibacter sp. Hel_I_33_5 TaxID=1566289 RepID=UPI00119D40DA|nr:hypothetical protein [Lutibacter sp. Hel_I_33_5]TVZ57258.1 hypothetical protein OD91_2576 [Lutibacter sp. Hel_I_33_5]